LQYLEFLFYRRLPLINPEVLDAVELVRKLQLLADEAEEASHLRFLKQDVDYANLVLEKEKSQLHDALTRTTALLACYEDMFGSGIFKPCPVCNGYNLVSCKTCNGDGYVINQDDAAVPASAVSEVTVETPEIPAIFDRVAGA
jgi:hypothetical protein